MRALAPLALLLALGCADEATDDGANAPGGVDETDVVDTDVADTDVGGGDTDDTVDTTPDDTDDTTPADSDVPRVDPNDPPTAAPPCGVDPGVHNGTVFNDLGVVPSPGAFTADPGLDGAFQIKRLVGKIPNPTPGRDKIPLTTYAPSTDGTALAPGPFPLVVVTPGFGYSYKGYLHFIEPLVTHGFVVVGMDFPNTGFADPPRQDKNALELRAVIDYALTLSPHAAITDPTKIAVLGHSAGGKAAFWAGSTDDRIDIVVGWDPQNGGGPPCAVAGLTGYDCNDAPVAPNCEANSSGLLSGLRAESLVFAAEDGLITPDAHLRAIHFYRGAPSTASAVHMPDAGHADWINNGATSKLTRRVHTALLLTRLKGYTGLDAWLPGGTSVRASPLVDWSATK